MVLLRLQELVKNFGTLSAINNVNFQMNEGEIKAIIGPNGAGKTTLFNLVIGRIKPTKGKILFDDKDITNFSTHKISRMGISRSFQVVSIFENLSVFENICLAIQVQEEGKPRFFFTPSASKKIIEETNEILEKMKLSNRRNILAKELSHGEKRRLDIGMALAGYPKLLLLDEPTAGMSFNEREETIDLISDLSKKYSIIFVEHDMDVVFSVAKTITVMQNGEIIAEGDPEKVKDNRRVQEAYLGGLR